MDTTDPEMKNVSIHHKLYGDPLYSIVTFDAEAIDIFDMLFEMADEGAFGDSSNFMIFIDDKLLIWADDVCLLDALTIKQSEYNI